MKKLIKLEYAALMLLTVYLYVYVFKFSVLLLLILLPTPDISMLGYLANNGIGAILYNSFHNVILPAIMLYLGLFFNLELLTSLELILFIHIFIDCAFGFGLKYNDNFKQTHMD